MVYHQPNLQIAAVVGTTADKVVEPYKVIKWQVGTKFKMCHTFGGDGQDGQLPCYCGQYFARWACGHWIKLPVQCRQQVSSHTCKPVFCKFKGKRSPEVVMDNLHCAEECDDCTALTKDAPAAFDALDREVGCVEVKREPSPS
ncbi:hypothetical protein PGQ11_011629 [Apiospora arundinis]|uniref:Uncharacterized protein n=1 Tax=Apiospora arundinis TaxID=335852 RepID=A0ABR2I0Q3_9PEZI